MLTVSVTDKAVTYIEGVQTKRKVTNIVGCSPFLRQRGRTEVIIT